MNKFEQVSSVDHQMSVAIGYRGLMSRGRGVPYHVTYCESLIFPHLRLRAVKNGLCSTHNYKFFNKEEPFTVNKLFGRCHLCAERH